MSATHRLRDGIKVEGCGALFMSLIDGGPGGEEANERLMGAGAPRGSQDRAAFILMAGYGSKCTVFAAAFLVESLFDCGEAEYLASAIYRRTSPKPGKDPA